MWPQAAQRVAALSDFLLRAKAAAVKNGAMMTAGTNGASARASEVREGAVRHPFMQVARLDDLLGAHPNALREYYRAGTQADPVELGEAPRGLLLAVEPARNVHFLVRPLVNTLGKGPALWSGKSFDGHGTGANLVLGRPVARFAIETGPSDIDGQPALILRYDDPALGNSWPVRNLRDELRMVGDGIALGPALFAPSATGERKVIVWFGLERRP